MSDLDIQQTEDEIDESKPEEPEEEISKEEPNQKKSKTKLSCKERCKLLQKKISDFFANPKKRLIFIICVGVIMIASTAFGLFFMKNDDSVTKKETAKKAATETEELFQAPLDGVMTDSASANRHPLAIIVENHPDARPQAGLDKASIVYEALAEGGITRFLGIFGTNEVEKVGPVRSVRTYFVDWAHGYDAYLAHVGGNMDALDKIPKDKLMDLDQFAYPASYWRERSGNLATEHTMYTSTVKLREQAAKNKYSTANNFNVLRFKENNEATAATEEVKPDSQKITVDFSSAQFKVAFDYDKVTNTYKRFLAGSSHIDQTTKNQLNPTNIVVMTVKKSATVTRINEPGWNMTTIGEGTAQIFTDGKVIKGTWKKNSASDRELFYDESGNEVVFNRGQFWICVIPPEGTVTVQ